MSRYSVLVLLFGIGTCYAGVIPNSGDEIQIAETTILSVENLSTFEVIDNLKNAATELNDAENDTILPVENLSTVEVTDNLENAAMKFNDAENAALVRQQRQVPETQNFDVGVYGPYYNDHQAYHDYGHEGPYHYPHDYDYGHYNDHYHHHHYPYGDNYNYDHHQHNDIVFGIPGIGGIGIHVH